MRRALLLTAAFLGLCAATVPSRAQSTLVVGGFGGRTGTGAAHLRVPEVRAGQQGQHHLRRRKCRAGAGPACKPSAASQTWTSSCWMTGRCTRPSGSACASRSRTRRAATISTTSPTSRARRWASAWPATGLGYNTKAFAERGWAPPTSWTDLGDPKYHQVDPGAGPGHHPGHPPARDDGPHQRRQRGQYRSRVRGHQEDDRAQRPVVRRLARADHRAVPERRGRDVGLREQPHPRDR